MDFRILVRLAMADQTGRISGKGSLCLSVPKLFLEQETQVLQPEADEEYESLFFF
jgi:hypothetical protein